MLGWAISSNISLATARCTLALTTVGIINRPAMLSIGSEVAVGTGAVMVATSTLPIDRSAEGSFRPTNAKSATIDNSGPGG